MAQSLLTNNQEQDSNENSVSTKEFLSFEKVCEAYKDSDEEIKMIFYEIHKLSAANNKDKVLSEETDDVELILKRAEDISLETENILKNCPVAASLNGATLTLHDHSIPQIKVTKAEVEHEENNFGKGNKVSVKLSKRFY